MAEITHPIPQAFVWKRLHSLTGVFIVLYLIEHLLVNSQAALFIGDDGKGFIHAVNQIQDLPYLPVIETLLLGVPIVIHMWWGIVYLRTSQPNYYNRQENKPICSDNPRNCAYSWQRITSWILLIGILAHVIHMRFLDYPTSAQVGTHHFYINRVERDIGLYTLVKRLGFQLYDGEKIKKMKQQGSSLYLL